MSVETLIPMDPIRKAWLEERRTYLGGSDMAKLLGISKWGGPVDVFLEKTGQGEEKPSNLYMDMGNFLEAAVAQDLSNKTGLRLLKGSMVRHPEESFVAGNPDFLVVDDPTLGVEIKVVSERARWSDDWGVEGSGACRLDYAIQCQWYMGLLGIPKWKLYAAFVDWELMERLQGIGLSAWQMLQAVTVEFRPYELAFDADLYANMRRVARDFWQGHVETGIQPTGFAMSQDAERLLLKRNAKMAAEELAAGPDEEALAYDYTVAKLAKKKAEETEKQLKAKLTAIVIGKKVKKLKGKGWSFGSIVPEEKPVVNEAGVIKDLVALAGISETKLKEIEEKNTAKVAGAPYTQGYMTSLEKQIQAAQHSAVA